MRRLWRRLFGPRPMSSDWCCECRADLPVGRVYEVRYHFDRTGEEPAEGGTWAALTYCHKHAPKDALRV